MGRAAIWAVGVRVCVCVCVCVCVPVVLSWRGCFVSSSPLFPHTSTSMPCGRGLCGCRDGAPSTFVQRHAVTSTASRPLRLLGGRAVGPALSCGLGGTCPSDHLARSPWCSDFGGRFRAQQCVPVCAAASLSVSSAPPPQTPTPIGL